MDVSALPNNNHPEKFLQLDAGMLPATHGMFQVGAVMSSQRHWHNRVFFQREGTMGGPPSPTGGPVVFVDRYLEKHITPVTLNSNIKTNPLCIARSSMDAVDNKFTPSWTVKERDTKALRGSLADYLKEDENSPKDLDFWLEDLYTPGFDSLLRKKEAEHKRKRLCKILSLVFLSICAVVAIVVPAVVLQRND
ncbi:major intrinsically disordered NOTCH2-binding receptor 1-like [Brachionichthys hirsutus]|uniref:major intrinsically disordered NOTCH2-binding receptor 1-like n=1 Tax=Brachionichthys hirsutus TaxID=412623 RepID=UPI003604E9F5